MKKISLLLYLFILCGSAHAESIIEYDPDNAIVSNRVVKYLKSVDSGPYMETPNCVTCPIANHLIDPDLSAVTGVQRAHWKVVDSSVVEMNQAEKDYIVQVASDNAAAAEADSVALFDSTLASSEVSDYALTKIDQSIDNISDLADAKAWLKKLARFIAGVHK
jgi:hypothetical protein